MIKPNSLLIHAIIGLLLGTFSSLTLAWGQIGHRVSGELASHFLTDTAKAELATLLPNQTLAEVTTYADDMRSNPSEFWQRTASPWHYVTVKQGNQYLPSMAPPQGDAVTALTEFTNTLENPNASLAEKQLALKFAIHIIADLHQPLHAGDGTDRGGNDVRVEFFWRSSNLHRVWDSGLIDRKQLSYTEWSNWLLPKISEQQRAEWSVTDPAIYIAESIDIRDTVYPETDSGETPKLNWDYLYQHSPTVNLRLQQAGVRIAAYLNEVLSEPPSQ